MFGSLTEKFQNLVQSFRGQKTFTEDNVSSAVRDVRLALLEADVSYSVASQFVKKIKEKVLGETVLQKVSPGEHFIKVVHEELIALMGSLEEPLKFSGSPTVILLCGLQGSGKTTQAAKLASYIQKKEGKKVLLAACDLQRPAAILQLKTLGEKIGTPVFAVEGEKDPQKVATNALGLARKEGFDVLIVDTAGRLHIDDVLMEELKGLKNCLNPQEILFVASAATGQEAVKVAKTFDEAVGITGSILTMLDGSARAGAAISIREVTQKPLKFEGIGEKIEDFRLFNPQSMADRILGMGDVINLVRKAEEMISDKEKEDLEKKLLKNSFTYEDYLKQMSMVRKMGSFKSLLSMLPGMSGMTDVAINEQELYDMEAMISSMTEEERQDRVELTPSRRHRIAKGSGMKNVDAVNRMVKKFKQLKQVLKNMPGLKGQLMKGGFNLPKNLDDMKEWMQK